MPPGHRQTQPAMQAVLFKTLISKGRAGSQRLQKKGYPASTG